MESWLFLDTGAHAAAWNMAADEALLHRKSEMEFPILRFYSWTHPAISIGYFQKWSPALDDGRDVVRRPTGGGLVEHGMGFTYSLVLPKSHLLAALSTLEMYQRIHGFVRSALWGMGIATEMAEEGMGRAEQCFGAPSCYDLVSDGQKIAGAAIRKTREGVLVQGELKCREQKMAEYLKGAVEEYLGAQFEQFSLTENLEAEIQNLVKQKYATDEWMKRFR